VTDLVAVDPNRIVAFHPVGFPGRPPAIRTTTVIVDDVYCVTGTSHFRRRGMTFDGGLDVANFDCSIVDGYCAGIANFRRRLMAEKMSVPAATTVATATDMWVRLASPEGCILDSSIDATWRRHGPHRAPVGWRDTRQYTAQTAAGRRSGRRQYGCVSRTLRQHAAGGLMASPSDHPARGIISAENVIGGRTIFTT
jgi:hypothetical protein